MPEPKDNPDLVPENIELDLLRLLVAPDEQRSWSVPELICEFNGTALVKDAIRSLCEAGLAHDLNGFIFAARPAVRFRQIIGPII